MAWWLLRKIWLKLILEITAVLTSVASWWECTFMYRCWLAQSSRTAFSEGNKAKKKQNKLKNKRKIKISHRTWAPFKCSLTLKCFRKRTKLMTYNTLPESTNKNNQKWKKKQKIRMDSKIQHEKLWQNLRAPSPDNHVMSLRWRALFFSTQSHCIYI